MTRWILVAALAVAACGKGPSEDQCREALDHILDLEFKRAGTAATADSQKTELSKQKAAIAEAKWPDFQKECGEKTAKDRIECILAATDLDQVAKCDEAN